MRQFFIVSSTNPPSITTLDPPTSIADFVADVPNYFHGKTMAIIHQDDNTEICYVLSPSVNGFVVYGTYPNYVSAFESALGHLLPITDNFSMPSTDAYQ